MKGVLTAAYGRKYREESEAISDFKAGKDFIFHNPSSQWDGMYCSIRDFKAGDCFELRYGIHNENVTIVNV